MARQDVKVSAVTTASASRVYQLLMDRSTVPLWSPMSSCALHKPGPGDPEGVGSIRRQVKNGSVGYDTIVELVPDRRFVYSHQGLPVRDYQGVVDLDEQSQGCRITWSASFTPRYSVSAWVLRAGVRRFLRQCVEGLAAHASEATER